MLRLPGLIDPHVHLRDPGQTHKEDFYTGTAAALAGGYTTVIDMPNNLEPTTTATRLDEKIKSAFGKIVCDVGFHFGSLGDNFEEFSKIQSKVLGLKIYLNQTTGNYIVDEKIFEKICKAWHSAVIASNAKQSQKPILVHAEENVLKSIINIAQRTKQRLHICHVSSQKELEIIINAKEQGFKVTCGVTPHHLFLCHPGVATTTIGSQPTKILSLRSRMTDPYFMMKPSLKSKRDQDFLWENLIYIDVVESDHAPHTKDEKESTNPPYGVPGLETTLPLLLTAMNEGRITKEEIIEKCYNKPKDIFHLPDQPATYIEIDETEEWTIKNENLYTKCKWSPFDGWKVKGKVKSVTIRGTKVFEDGKVLVEPGFGEIVS